MPRIVPTQPGNGRQDRIFGRMYVSPGDCDGAVPCHAREFKRRSPTPRALEDSFHAAASEDPITVSPVTLIAKRLSVHPLSMYYAELLSKLRGWMEHGAGLIQSGDLHGPIAAIYPASPLSHALKPAIAGGKVFLDFTQPS